MGSASLSSTTHLDAGLRGRLFSTGYYAQQVKTRHGPGCQKRRTRGKARLARLLPEMLKPYGYRTYHSGKWHVDGKPLENGFDHSYSLDDHDRHFALPAPTHHG